MLTLFSRSYSKGTEKPTWLKGGRRNLTRWAIALRCASNTLAQRAGLFSPERRGVFPLYSFFMLEVVIKTEDANAWVPFFELVDLFS